MTCNHCRFDAECPHCVAWLEGAHEETKAELERVRKELARWRSDEAVVELRVALRVALGMLGVRELEDFERGMYDSCVAVLAGAAS